MKAIINFLLAIIARVSFYFLGLFLYIIGVILTHKRSQYHLNIGIAYDQLGNVVGAPLFNVILRKYGGARFGNPDETISSVLGKLKRTGHLTALGKFFADMLNKIEVEHVEKAIEEDENIKSR
jgi:8-oxo-dGTP diphosphatase